MKSRVDWKDSRRPGLGCRAIAFASVACMSCHLSTEANLSPSSIERGSVIYVDADASGGGDGTSWGSAFNDLQDGLAAAAAGDEIWLAEGVYTPDRNSQDRAISFIVPGDVAIYGGFVGNETSRDQRDWTSFVSELSGDLNGDDQPGFVNYGDNSYHVLFLQWLPPASRVVLDGITISSGNADATSNPNRRGAGLYFEVNNATTVLEISACRFTGNRAKEGGAAYLSRGDVRVHLTSFAENEAFEDTGGAIQMNTSLLQVSSCSFDSNAAGLSGGAVRIDNFQGTPQFDDCTFSFNVSGTRQVGAAAGGALLIGSASNSNLVAMVKSCVFLGNSAYSDGGALSCGSVHIQIDSCDFEANVSRTDGGGISLWPQDGASIVNCRFFSNHAMIGGGGGVYIRGRYHQIANCLFTGNSCAGSGGGLLFADTAGGRNILDCTFYGNSASNTGGGAYIYNQTEAVQNSIFWGNADSIGIGELSQLFVQDRRFELDIDYCCIDGWTGILGGVGNHGLNPLFVDPAGADGVVGTADDDLRLGSGSPCIDSGNNERLPPDSTDLDGDGDTEEPLPIDLGAGPRRIDDPNTNDTGNGIAPIVDIGAYEFGEFDPPIQYVGPSGGTWFNASHWSNGSLPHSDTDVEVDRTVVVDQAGAVARDIYVLGGGVLEISTGDLAAREVFVRNESQLRLTDPVSRISARTIAIESASGLSWESGTIEINTGILTYPSALLIGCSESSTLILADGGRVSVPVLSICTLGTVLADGSINAQVENDGLISPGQSPGLCTINGTFEQSASGRLLIELGGYAAGSEYDALAISGTATLGGTLDVVLLNGFSHQLGERQTFLMAQNISGSFDVSNIPGLPAGAYFAHEQTTTSRTLFTLVTPTGSRLYVDDDSTGGGNGQSWSATIRSLFGAMEVASNFPQQINEIWVANGVYHPGKRTNPNDPRTARFSVTEGLSLFGGFAGGETDLSQRNISAHPTVLSGDLNGDDQPDFQNYDENVTVVLYAQHGSAYTIDTFVDGFIVTHAASRGCEVWTATPIIRNCIFSENAGGGVNLSANTTIEDCRIEFNRFFGQGAGLLGGSGRIVRCAFVGNRAEGSSGEGGGVYFVSNGGVFIDCTFVGNDSRSSSWGGGAARVFNEVSFINCRFLGNTARGSGAALMVWNDQGNRCHLINCILSGNHAETGNGAGAHVVSGSQIDVVNSVVANNVSGGQFAGVVLQSSSTSAQVSNSILWNNQGSGGNTEAAQVGGPGVISINYSTVMNWSGGLGGTGNIGSDPQFQDPDGEDDSIGTPDDNYRVLAGSPAIDSADNDAVPLDLHDLDGDGVTNEPIPLELDGYARFYDDPNTIDTGHGTPPIIDRGAYEFGAVNQQVNTYIGPADGSWFDQGNWSRGKLPTSEIDVVIPGTVRIDQSGAVARNVSVTSQGQLIIETGSLNALSVSVGPGGHLRLTSVQSYLEVQNLTLQSGAVFDWLAGTIHINGGVFVSNQIIVVGTVGPATLRFSNGGTLNAPQLIVPQLGTVAGSGSVLAVTSVEGAIEPGASPGAISFGDDLTLESSAILRIDVEGYEPGVGHDVILTNGSAMLAGTLEISTSQNFQPQTNRISFLTAPSVEGTITIDAPALPDGFSWHLELASTRASLFTAPPGPLLRVDVDAADGGTGATWESAINDLELALSAARLNVGQISEIWVAEGTYVPSAFVDNSDTRSATFSLISDVALFGGFAGDETERDQRDIDLHPTILSGDVLGDDESPFINRDDNMYRIVSAIMVIDSALLDGFTLRGGHAGNTQGSYTWTGGGIYIEEASPFIRNCSIEDCYAANYGGGAYCKGANTFARFESCRFLGNAVPACYGGCFDGIGGGAFVGDLALITFVDCWFEDNEAKRGGGLAIEDEMRIARATVQGCEFVGNRALLSGASVSVRQGGTLNMSGCNIRANGLIQPVNLEGGGIEVHESTASISNSTFMALSARTGGALIGRGDQAQLDVTNCVFDSNSAIELWGGAMVVNDRGLYTVSGSTFLANSAVLHGGAIAVFDSAFNVNATFVDCQFTGNSAGEVNSIANGGAVAVPFGDGNENRGPTFVGCHFEDNSATGSGAAIFNSYSVLTLEDTSFVDNTSPDQTTVVNLIGRLRGTATAFGAGGDLVNTRFFRPGLGTGEEFGSFTIDSSLWLTEVQFPPILEIDIAGTTPGLDMDSIDVTNGTAHLDGGLLVKVINDYVPPLGTQFVPLAAGSLQDRFDVISVSGLPESQYFAVEYGTSGISLTVERIAGDIEFGSPNSVGLTGEPADAVLADFDGDGDSDVALAMPDSDLVVVLLNAGMDGNGDWLGFTGGFVETEVGNGPVALLAGDFDGDTYSDLGVVNAIDGTVSILHNDADGKATFTVVQTLVVGSNPADITLGELNGSAGLDLVAAVRGAGMLVPLINDGGGTFALGAGISAGSDPHGVETADMNGDGRDDLVVLTRTILNDVQTEALAILLSDGGTGFGGPLFDALDRGASEMVLADLTQDAWIDVVAACQEAGTVSVLVNEGRGDGAMTSAVNIPVGDDAVSVGVFDVEGDGDFDLVVAARNLGGQRSLHLLRNDVRDGQLVLASATELSTDGDPVLVRVDDVNDDGEDDLVAVNTGGASPFGTASVAGLVNDSSANAADLTAFNMVKGIVLDGDLDSLRSSDDVYLHTRSGFGQSFIDLHHMEVQIDAHTNAANPSLIDVLVEARIDHPTGLNQLRLFNWTSNQWDLVHSGTINTTEAAVLKENLNATKYVDANGNIRLSVRHTVYVPQLAFTFQSFIDQVQMTVE